MDEVEKNLIDEYVRLHSERTDAPKSYATALIASLIGHKLGRSSVHKYSQPLRHNCYIMLVGDAGKTRKSVSMDILNQLIPHRVLSSEFTPESFISALSRSPSGIYEVDEVSSVLKKAGNKGSYMSGIIEIFNKLYGWSREEYSRETKSGGLIRVLRPYLSIRMALTEEALKESLSAEMVAGGFISRTILIPEQPVKWRQRKYEDEVSNDEAASLLEVFKRIPEGIAFRFNSDARVLFDKYDTKLYTETVHPSTSRYGDYIIKLADIMEVARKLYSSKIFTSNTIDVTTDSVEWAYSFMHSLIGKTKDVLGDIEVNGVMRKIKKILRQKAPCTRRVILQYGNIMATDLTRVIHTLKESGWIWEAYDGRRKAYCCKDAVIDGRCQDCKYRDECSKGKFEE